MPLFFFISAYLFSIKNGMRDYEYKEWIKHKFLRLMLPYIILNLICFIPKFVLQNFMPDKLDFSIDTFLMLLFNPKANILGHTWFLFALFQIYLLSPIWNKCLIRGGNTNKNKIIWIVLFSICIVLRLFPIETNILNLNDLCNDLLFFVMGLFLGNISEKKMREKSTKKNFLIYLILFIISTTLWILWKNTITNTILCTTTLMVLFKLPLAFNIENKIFDDLGKYSYTIYILHWPCMLSIRILLYQILHLNDWFVSIMMAISGYLLPIIIIKTYQKIKEKTKFNSKIIYYLLGM